MKAYVIDLVNPEEAHQPALVGPLARVLYDRAEAQAECERVNGEQSRAFYAVTEVEVDPDAVQSYVAARAAVEAAEDRASEVAHAAFLAGCHALFEAHADLHSFGWRQYTLWSRCASFTSEEVDCDEPDVNGVEGHLVDGRPCGVGEDGELVRKGEASPQAKLQHEVAAFLGTFHEDDLLDLFGVDALVTVHRDGRVEAEEYYDDSVDNCGCDDLYGDDEDEDSDDEDDGFDEED
jgi:hypothetical protein